MPLLSPTGQPLAPAAANAPATLSVAREELATITAGKIVAYHVIGPTRLTLAASRQGVELIGQTPPIGTRGMPSLIRLIRRQLRQHEALAATPVGEPQVPLTEEELDQLETQAQTVVPGHFGPMMPSAGGPTHGRGV